VVMNKLLLLNMNVSGCLVGFVQFHVLTFLLPCCDVRVKTMISSSLFCKGLMYYCIYSRLSLSLSLSLLVSNMNSMSYEVRIDL
jgi:hypothetical protein